MFKCKNSRHRDNEVQPDIQDGQPVMQAEINRQGLGFCRQAYNLKIVRESVDIITFSLKPPLDFIKHICNICISEHKYEKHNIKGHCHTISVRHRLETIFAENIQFVNNPHIQNHCMYTITISLNELIKMNPVHWDYMKKQRLERLLCLKRLTNNYTIYYVMTEYMRNTPSLLF